MIQSGGPIAVEPGKQLPQTVTVQVGDNSAKREVTIRYLLFTPQNYQANGEAWPLLLFLHCLGECSNDDLSRAKIHGPAKIVERRPDFPFILVTPQSPPPPGYSPDLKGKLSTDELIALVCPTWKADELIKLVDHVTNKLNIDRDRVYVTGLSMGGYGTWRLVAKYPDRFAAAVPICGGRDPTMPGMSDFIKRVPIWAFHGAKDKVVPLSESQYIVDAVRYRGGDVRFTIYPDVEHNSWEPAYENQEVYDWLLAHRRNQQ